MARCLVVGAAPSEGKAFNRVLQMFDYDAIIAADGGYKQIKKIGIEPFAVFGDFDSLGYIPDHPRLNKFDTHKDFTDLDLALEYVFEQSFDEVIVCDAFTGRLDHSIGNLQLLIKYAKRGMEIKGVTEEEVIAPLVAPGKFSSLSFDSGAWGTLSVISHSDIAHGVTEEGFGYQLDDATCFNHILWGISNELIGKQAQVSLKEGSLWVFFPLEEMKKAHYC